MGASVIYFSNRVLVLLRIRCRTMYRYIIPVINLESSYFFTITVLVTIKSVWKQILYLIIYHILFGMFLWSYWQTVFTKSDKVPDKVSEIRFYQNF